MLPMELEETDRRRRRLARRFVEATSPSERFAISRELGRLLELRRELARRTPRASQPPFVTG